MSNPSYGNSLSWLAFAFNVGLNLSQLPLMRQMLLDDAAFADPALAAKYKAAPAINQIITAGMWLSYAAAVLPSNTALFANNIIGLAAALLYVAAFLYARPGAREKARVALAALAALATPVLIYASLYAPGPPRAARDAWASALTTLITAAFWASPLVALRAAVRDLDAARVPVPLTLLMLCTTATWLAVGVFIGDITLIVCSAIGVFFSALQLAALGFIAAAARGAEKGAAGGAGAGAALAGVGV
jgi:hypothetical protein